jgi:antirestriction protein ArdC
MTTTTRHDVYAQVTDRIIEDLAKGVRPWLKPWAAGRASESVGMPLRHNGTPYRGINVLLLWNEAITKGYSSSTWMTYKQAFESGGHVRKGEHGSLVVYADRFTTTEQNDNGEDVEHSIHFMKAYTVFNAEQVDGLPAPVTPEHEGEPLNPAQHAEAFFGRTGARFQHGGDKAFYMPSQDLIQLPPIEAFRDAESYAATKAHELLHWTGKSGRMGREFGKRFGDTAYAREELVAELGSAFLCATLGITPEPREDHAAYLSHWLAVLKGDKRAIFSAAAHAQRAVDYLHGLQPAD